MNKLTRSDIREKVMQCFYQVEFSIENNQDYDATIIALDIFHCNEFDKIPLYARELYVCILDNYDDLKKIVSNNLINWTFSRLDPLLISITFTSLAEGIYLKKTPRKVVINEGIKLAKKYCSKDDYKFINALLDKAIVDYECY